MKSLYISLAAIFLAFQCPAAHCHDLNQIAFRGKITGSSNPELFNKWKKLFANNHAEVCVVIDSTNTYVVVEPRGQPDVNMTATESFCIGASIDGSGDIVATIPINLNANFSIQPTNVYLRNNQFFGLNTLPYFFGVINPDESSDDWGKYDAQMVATFHF